MHSYVARVCAVLAFSAVALAAVSQTPSSTATDLDPAKARDKIIELNKMWGKARVEFDKPTYEKTLAPDFYVEIDGQKQTRQQFIDEISQQSPNVKFLRFDVNVLTVMKNGDHWDAVIAEKLEAEGKGPDGKTHHLYSLWVTRDGWKQTGDQWQALYSVAIGHENWRDQVPPDPHWVG